ncbi:Slp family lipoprotein [Geobacter argillaceus]|uniref:Outer membrane lipoprotein n=1 Tax=Geobacter argillaceus TaxID=345631 RepID=A0A562W8J6_9BACT|nr:Slp family lipoprotein [Geobacter argillaceus]TWJ26418.1 outer membrane lipoprotein [Geobacter argillaceus]
MKGLAILVVMGLMALSGCARVISDQSRSLVDPTVQFAKLRDNPDNYIGKTVLLGGRIASARNTKEGGVLEIVQFELDGDVPRDSFISHGRFLATSVDFLDSLIYKPDRLVTLVGEVKGKKTLPLDAMEYTYPVVAIREIYLWQPSESEKYLLYPPSRYNPYYYGYGSEPYWDRPSLPALQRLW